MQNLVAVGVNRVLDIIELLASQTDGIGLAKIAEGVDLPKSAAHRILADLIASGYAHQLPNAEYALTLKFDTLGMRHLARNGLIQLSRLPLMGLARKSQALVRLSLIEGNDLRFVAQYQGASSGLRYDPEAGNTARLSCSASGMAWMSQLSEEEALQRILRQGIGSPGEFGPRMPTTLDEVRALLAQTRARGWATVDETYEAGTSALAAPILDPSSGRPVGVASIAGPSVLLTARRREELSADLLEVCADLSHVGVGAQSVSA